MNIDKHIEYYEGKLERKNRRLDVAQEKGYTDLVYLLQSERDLIEEFIDDLKSIKEGARE